LPPGPDAPFINHLGHRRRQRHGCRASPQPDAGRAAAAAGGASAHVRTEPEASEPATDAGRWQGDDLEGLPRQPLYTMAASRGIPERRLSQMSREDILEMLLRRDRAAGTS
jgi:hypothetical protein